MILSYMHASQFLFYLILVVKFTVCSILFLISVFKLNSLSRPGRKFVFILSLKVTFKLTKYDGMSILPFKPIESLSEFFI